MKCKKCGTEFSEGIFCPMCGTKNEDVIIDQEKVAEIEKKERQQAEEAAIAEAKKKIEKEKEIIRNNAEKNAREEAVKVAQEKARKNISSDDEDIKSEALKRVREEAIQNARLEEERKQQEEADRKAKEEKKINRKAIISLVLGIASWVGMITVILPIVGGIWAIVDGCKALKGKTKYKKSAIFGIILPILLYLLLVITCVQDVKEGAERETQLNSYIENGQYAEAQEFITQEYRVGTLSYVEKCAQLYELQGMYDEAVDLWVEYCSKEYDPVDIPDFRINKINEYLDKYRTDLKPETIEKVHNLINSKEVAKAEKEAAEQAAKEAKEAEEQVEKERKQAEEKVIKVNDSEDDMGNNTTANNSGQTDVSNVENTVHTWYNNGNPHTYKYEDKDYYIIAELQMRDYDDSGFDISLTRYDYDKDYVPYTQHAFVSIVEDEKGNDHGSNGTYYRGWNKDGSGTEIFVEYNYKTEYCKIRMTIPRDEKGYNFEHVFDYEYIYYPEEADGVDDGIADLDDSSYLVDTFFWTNEGDLPKIAEENIGKTFRLTCTYMGLEDGYMSFYHDSHAGSSGIVWLYSKTDKDFGSFFSGDQVCLTAILNGRDIVGSDYEFIVDIIDLQRIN